MMQVTIPLDGPSVLEIEGERVELTLRAWLSKAHYFSYGRREADENYRFLVFQVRGRNLGRRLVSVRIMDNAEVLVDRGYIYRIATQPCFALRPEEVGVDYAVFEILSTVKPVEVTWEDEGQHFVIDLRDGKLEELKPGKFEEIFRAEIKSELEDNSDLEEDYLPRVQPFHLC